ncbi:MAG: hypothetical protein IJL95_09620, partial [Solobacterium sp.]|nr:hypothetical protein [Solobacterium sp.]
TSVYGTAGAILIGVPVGFMTAVYLSKLASPKVKSVMQSAVSLLAGIVVYHEAVSFKSLLGCLFIVISGIVVVMDKKTDTEPES